ncbi:MAG: succinylglutamate desuccinylase/aspartoacylase family protein, partial [Bryobacterales bacterium]|nr:succinylglutamate desuccinylase/aspartoacylase family protein [Bryobacterales bacterium]
MRSSDFDPGRFATGTLYRLDLEFEAAGLPLALPVLLARGAQPGKCLAATAAVHGDEYEGVQAIFDVFDELDPQAMAGDFLAVPIANPPAFTALSRTSPLDGLNLARVFPGKADGTPTEAIAWRLDQHIIRHADLFIDLHSGGVRYEMPSMAGYWAGDGRAEAAARAFGAAIVWGHPEVGEGRSLSAARVRGIPAIYTEARGAGRIHPDDLQLFSRGLLNLMRHLGIVEGSPEAEEPQVHLFGDGNIDHGIAARHDGFLAAGVRLLEAVTKDQELGRLLDAQGCVIERCLAPCDGRVALV